MTDPNRDDTKAGAAGQADESSKGFPEFIIAPPGAAPPEPDEAPRPFEPSGPHRFVADSATTVHPERSMADTPHPNTMHPVAAARAPKARGGGLALLAALVAMLAAGASIAAPSLRPILAEKLRQQFGEHELIAVLTGTAETRAPGVVELDLQALDQRIGALAQALGDTPDGQTVDPGTLERFVTAAGQDERFAGLEAAVRQAEDQVLTLSKALGALETRLAKVDTRADLLEGADGALAGRIDAAEAAARDLAPKLAAVEGAAAAAAATAAENATAAAAATAKAEETATRTGTLSGMLDTLSATAAQIGARIDAVEARIGEMVSAVQANTESAAATAETVKATTEQAKANAAAVQANADSITAAAERTTALGAELTARLVAVEAGAGDLVGRLDKVEAALTAEGERIGRTEQELAATRDGLTATRQAVEAAAGGLADVTARTAAVEDHMARVNGGTASALLALSSRIRQALEDGESFIGEVAAVRALAGGNPDLSGAIETLQQLAERGGPTLTLLRREFNLAAQKIIDAEEASGPAWYVRSVSTMSAQVTSWFGWVQPPVPAPGEEARAVVTEAAKSFTLGRIDEAVRVLKTLSGPGAPAAEPWIRLAQVRIDAERALRALSNAALVRLSTP